MISKDQIREFSKRLSIDEFTVIREYIQVIFLSVLYRKKESQNIYFKGGTAIRLLFNSDRFSEDLDFTAELTIKELNNLLQDVIKKINLVILNITLKKINEGRTSFAGILSYHIEDSKFPLNVHVEFSIREKPQNKEEVVLETEFPISFQPVIRHLSWQEMLAEKIRAFMHRAKGRDVYDLWFLLSKGVEIDWKLVDKKMKYYKKKISIQDVIRKVSKFDDKKLKNDLQKFLPSYNRNIVFHLKQLLLKQLFALQEFTIRTSDNLGYTKIPSGSFSSTEKLIYDLKKTKITKIERQNDNIIRVDIKTEEGGNLNGYIKVKNKKGVKELNKIENNKSLFKGKSYDELINYKFRQVE